MVECRKEDVLPASIAMTTGCDQRHADVAIDCFLDVVSRLRSQVGEAVYVAVRHLRESCLGLCCGKLLYRHRGVVDGEGFA